ncbi:MAG: sel1 repeat family protein [Archangium sp.]|nr:sel1 repeat family protein [Archangium sp.]
MRLWGVVVTLGLLIVVSLGVRTARGWSPTQRERWEAQCDRDQLAACEALGDDLLYGRTGPVDRPRGIAILEETCSRKAGQGCAILGAALLASGDAKEKARAEVVLRRGCDLKSADACAHLGDFALGAGRKQNAIALFRQACEGNSRFGCSMLGELAFTSPSIAPEEADTAFERACELKDAWACFRQAQSLACGRGQKADPERALPALRTACVTDGLPEACAEWVQRESADGGMTISGKPHARALIGAAFARAQSDDFDAARTTLAAFDGGLPFAQAAIELSAGNLEAADAWLARAPKEQVEARVVREIAQERRKGTRWPDAAWLGWAHAGMPDLRQSEWIPGENFAHYPCSEAITETIDTEAAFIRAVARSHRTRLDERYDAPVLKAAMRYASSDRLSVALLALAVLGEQVQNESTESVIVFEKSARASFAAKHGGSLFLESVALPSDLRNSAASPDDFAKLFNLTRAPDERPLRALFDDYVQLLGPGRDSRGQAFSALITATSTIDVIELPGWLERGGHDAERRAAVLRDLGARYVKRTWLVDHYLGAALLRASLKVEDHEPTRRLERETMDELKRLRTGPTGLSSLSTLPFKSLDLDAVIDDEMGELRRLHALAVKP